MESWEKLIGNKNTAKGWQWPAVTAPDETIRKRVLENWDRIAKPIEGMGRFETLTAQIGAITGSEQIDLSRKAVLVMCADNGVVEEGISQSGQEVTAAVAEAMGAKKSSVCRMAGTIGADVIPVDIGINKKEPIPGVLDRKVKRGTENFRRGPAMTEEEAVRAIAVGMDMVSACQTDGYRILATGEMGIGNTTTSSAVTSALTGCEAKAVTGRGAGLDDAGWNRKCRIIAEAVETYDLKHASPIRVLSAVGGLDIAGLAGVCMGGAVCHVPIVLDGVISLAAALLAERILPGTRAYLLPSHKGKEPAAERLLQELKLEPVIDAGLALGEGTGAVMMFSLLDMALSIYNGGTGFSEIGIAPYKRGGQTASPRAGGRAREGEKGL